MQHRKRGSLNKAPSQCPRWQWPRWHPAAPQEKGRPKPPQFGCLPSPLALGNHHPMHWWEETVHPLVVMHDFKQQKQLEAAIRDLVRLAVERATLEGYQQGYEDGKRRAVN